MMDLPVEAIQRIFSFLSPCEIIQLRQVSKHFGDITHNSSLWREKYANSGLFLPPGPFPSQSTRYLERTLVQSELVSRTWMSQPPRSPPHVMISRKRGRISSWTMVLGRWCIFKQGNTIQCHDINADTYHSLYKASAQPTFLFILHTGSVTDINGYWVYIWLLDVSDESRPSLLLLTFLVHDDDDDDISKPEIMDLTHAQSRSSTTWHSTCNFNISTPFVPVPGYEPCVVLDLRSRYLYRLPAARIQSNVRRYQNLSIILTRTHVIAVQVDETKMLLPRVPVLVQAFVVPDSASPLEKHEIGELRLTHEVTIRVVLPHSYNLLRNSVVDPVTGLVSIRLLQITDTFQIGHMRMSCLDLTLPKPSSTTDVLPITIRSQDLLESECPYDLHTVSDNGHVRGLLFADSGPSDLHIDRMRKFTIDASGEECTIAVTDPFPFKFTGQLDRVVFDGVGGQFCYMQEGFRDENRVIMVDVA